MKSSPTDWQKDYFQGRDAIGREAEHVSHDQSEAAAGAGHFHRDGQSSLREFRRPGSAPPAGLTAESGSKGVVCPRVDVAPATSVQCCDGRVTNQRLALDLFSVHVAIAMMDHESTSWTMNEEIDDFEPDDAEEGPAADGPSTIAPAAAAEAAAAPDRVDDEWRRWIAENLMVGQSPESLFEAMTSSGFLRRRIGP